MIIGNGWIYLRHVQGKLTLYRAALACLLLTVMMNKVLSPQYFIWILPLVAIVEGLNWRWVLICVLTSAIYPFLYLFNVLSFGAMSPGTYGPLFAGPIVLRNALLPVVTMLAMDIGRFALPTALFVETAFGLPGLGKVLYDALQRNDLPVLVGVVVFTAAAIVVLNLVADLLYVALDPRVKLQAVAVPA